MLDRKASSQLEALEGSQGVTALTVNNDNEGNGGDNNAGNIFSGGVGGGGSGGAGGGGGGGDDQAVASAFRILKASAFWWERDGMERRVHTRNGMESVIYCCVRFAGQAVACMMVLI